MSHYTPKVSAIWSNPLSSAQVTSVWDQTRLVQFAPFKPVAYRCVALVETTIASFRHSESPRHLHLQKELSAIPMIGRKVVPSDQEEKAGEFVQDFLQPFLEGSEDYEQEYSPGTATAIVTKGEVALAAQTLLLWKSSQRMERLTRWLIGLTGTLVALTIVLAILTWRLGG